MVALVTLAAAKRHLRVDFADDDADITEKIEWASEACLNYIKRRGERPTDAIPAPPDYDETTAPPWLRAAVCIAVSWFYDDRKAGAPDNPNIAMGYLPVPVTALLHRHRDPALA